MYTCEDEVRPTLNDEFESVQLGEDPSRSVKIGYGLSPEIRSMLIECLQVNINLFSVSPYKILGIDPQVACHQLMDVST